MFFCHMNHHAFQRTEMVQLQLHAGLSLDVTTMVVMPCFFAEILPFETDATEESRLLHDTDLSAAFVGRTVACRTVLFPACRVTREEDKRILVTAVFFFPVL